jgi:hypothetical protein
MSRWRREHKDDTSHIKEVQPAADRAE